MLIVSNTIVYTWNFVEKSDSPVIIIIFVTIKKKKKWVSCRSSLYNYISMSYLFLELSFRLPKQTALVCRTALCPIDYFLEDFLEIFRHKQKKSYDFNMVI